MDATIAIALKHYEAQKRASKKYYDAHADKIKEKKREIYKEKKLKTDLNILST